MEDLDLSHGDDVAFGRHGGDSSPSSPSRHQRQVWSSSFVPAQPWRSYPRVGSIQWSLQNPPQVQELAGARQREAGAHCFLHAISDVVSTTQAKDLHGDLNSPGLRGLDFQEPENSAGFCAGMRKWMQYCHHRTEDKLHGAVYMVTEHAGERERWGSSRENFDLTWQETVLHGSIKQGEGSLRGIGGGTRTTGVKEFYVGLAGENGERVPAKTASTSEDPALERVLQRQCILLWRRSAR